MKASIVVVKGRLDALDYFIDRFVDYLKKKELEYYLIDLRNPNTFGSNLIEYLNKNNCYMFTFNNVGIDLSIKNENVWKKCNVEVIDYIVDAPRYFEDTLLNPQCNLNVVCLDKNHINYVKKFYPKVKNIFFSPNGGTEVNCRVPIYDRKIDVIYMGNCQLEPQFVRIDKFDEDESRKLYSFCVNRLVAEPQKNVESIIEEYLIDIGKQLDDSFIRNTIEITAGLIEGEVRRYYKLSGIVALDKLGISVDIWGDGWNDQEYKFSDNIKIHERVSPDKIMKMVGNAKISLCFIPWFKRGCSEKNFDSMLNGAVCVTDKSEYLLQHYVDGYNIVYFDLNNLEQMAFDIKYLLEHLDVAETIAQRGYETAARYDTWEKRFDKILEYMEIIQE